MKANSTQSSLHTHYHSREDKFWEMPATAVKVRRVEDFLTATRGGGRGEKVPILETAGED